MSVLSEAIEALVLAERSAGKTCSAYTVNPVTYDALLGSFPNYMLSGVPPSEQRFCGVRLIPDEKTPLGAFLPETTSVQADVEAGRYEPGERFK